MDKLKYKSSQKGVCVSMFVHEMKREEGVTFREYEGRFGAAVCHTNNILSFFFFKA